jgi:fructose-1,6-bisphosphatase/inositol monophosphatase family enzyme
MEGALALRRSAARGGRARPGLTAAGTFDGYFEVNLNTWDLAGAALVLRSEGGSRLVGRRWLDRERDILAATRRYTRVPKLAQDSPT